MDVLNEKQIDLIHQMLRELPEEQQQAFKTCMRVEAFYKSGLPFGIFGALLSHWMIPKVIGPVRYVITALSGLTMFRLGIVAYAPKCRQNLLDSLGEEEDTSEFQERGKLSDDPIHLNDMDPQDEQNKFVTPSDRLLDNDFSSNNYDTFSDSMNYFDNMGSDFQNELVTEQPSTKAKKHVTYQDLWVQHKKRLLEEHHRNFKRRSNEPETVSFEERAASSYVTSDKENTSV